MGQNLELTSPINISNFQMMSPKIIPNEYFFTGKPFSLLAQLQGEDVAVGHQTLAKALKRKQSQAVSQSSRNDNSVSRLPFGKESTIRKEKSLFRRDSESMYVPAARRNRDQSYSQIMDLLNYKQKGQKLGRTEQKGRKYNNRINEEYFGKVRLEEGSKPKLGTMNSKALQRIKRPLSEIKSRVNSRNSQQKERVRQRLLKLPSILEPKHVKGSPELARVAGNAKSRQILPCISPAKKAPLPRTRSLKQNTLAHRKPQPTKSQDSPVRNVDSLKMRTEENRRSRVQTQPCLNQTLADLRVLGEIKENSAKLNSDRMGYASILLDIQFNNRLFNLQKNPS